MRFTRLKLENWRNFRSVDIELRRRVFLVGPNAAGKSNLLDVFRFLHDVADPEGGLPRAVLQRGGVSQIRSLFARRNPNVAIEVDVNGDGGPAWSFRLEFTDEKGTPVVRKEIVREGGTLQLERPLPEDEGDPRRLRQTHLEQLNANQGFRELADFLATVRYLHVVPQLVRDPDRSAGRAKDPYGGDFLEQIARAPSKQRTAKLNRIQKALKVAVPQLKELELRKDARGIPHLAGLYEHWRPKAGWQNETQFSDGSLRLLGLLWGLLDDAGPLLLEEPELSLHSAVVHHIPAMMARVNRKLGRQVVLSTHSKDLLLDPGIAPEEVFLLVPSREGTEVVPAASDRQIRALLEAGVSMGEAVVPRTAPKGSAQLSLFGG